MKEYINGDLVIYKSLMKEHVAEICEVCETSYLIRFMGSNFARVTSDEIKPIPLTPEIFEKNGWKETKHVVEKDWYEYYKYENENDFLPEIEFYPKNNARNEESFAAFWGDTEIRPDIHYLHELQHLLFGLGLNHEMEV